MSDDDTSAFVINPLIGKYKFDTSVTQLEDDFLPHLDKTFTSLLLKRGRIFSSTALRNIQYSTQSLKKFSSQLAADINLHESENLNSVYYHVDIHPINSEVQHPCPLKVVVQRTNGKNEENGNTTVYVGVFHSWRMKSIIPCRDYLNLPFLFSAGSQKFTGLLNDLFEKYFGCKISPVLFTQHEIKWLVAIVVQFISLDAITAKNLQLVYQIEASDLKMDFWIPFEHMKDRWNDIHDDTRSEIRYEEVVRLYTAVDEHIQETFGFDLSHFHLKRFTVPDHITIDTDGKINVLKPEILDLLFRFLKDRASFS